MLAHVLPIQRIMQKIHLKNNYIHQYDRLISTGILLFLSASFRKISLAMLVQK